MSNDTYAPLSWPLTHIVRLPLVEVWESFTPNFSLSLPKFQAFPSLTIYCDLKISETWQPQTSTFWNLVEALTLSTFQVKGLSFCMMKTMTRIWWSQYLNLFFETDNLIRATGIQTLTGIIFLLKISQELYY